MLDRRIEKGGRYLLNAALAAFAILLLPTEMAAAQSGDVFTIENIEVDSTGASDLEAKEKGVAAAKRSALDRLLRRITTDRDVERLPEVSGDRIELLIRDVTFDSEKFGGGHYFAELTVRFQRDAIRELMRREGIAYAETRSRPLVVVPVLSYASGDPILWSGVNPWLDAWIDYPTPNGLVPIIVPFGDLNDISTIDAEEAVAGDPESLNAIANLYNAGGAVVAIAHPGSGGDREISVTTTVNASGWNPVSTVSAYTVPESPTQKAAENETEAIDVGQSPPVSADDLFAAAVEGVISDLEDMWTRENLLRFDLGATRLSLRAPLTQLADFVQIRRRLEEAPPVRNVTLDRLTVREARLSLDYLGDVYQLQTALVQKGLRLELGEGEEVWTVRRAGAGE